MKNKKWIVLVSVVVMVFIGIVYAFKSHKSAVPLSAFKTATVSRQTIEQIVSANGKIKSKQSVTLSFGNSGSIDHLYFDELKNVKKNQIIAILDTSLLHNEKNQLESDLKVAKIDLNDSETDFHNNEILYQKGFIAKEIYTKSQFKRDSQSEKITKLNEMIKNTNRKIELSQIVAPFDGTIVKVDKDEHEYVPAYSPVIEMSDFKTLYILATVDETDIGSISVGTPAHISLDAYPNQTLRGSVTAVSLTPNITKTNEYDVSIAIPTAPSFSLRLEMSANIDFIVKSVNNALSVPQEALIEQKGENFIYITDGKSILKRPVKVGISGDKGIEILSGLVANETVIISDFDKIIGK